ncbi:MAG: N-acetylmuramic acid 6-phosphate etherase [Hyphomonadaceae bacterium]|nr:N-acetylmuramic acid 6-phosphate etherase [Hyphomonadaceae bacterium]
MSNAICLPFNRSSLCARVGPMTTEDVSPRFLDLDLWETIDGLKALHEGQMEAVAAVKPALPAIAAAVDAAVPRLRRGGRLVYVGAGTSGRIAVQDGAELLPTFNWPSEQVVFAIAGGERALLRAVENAEDSGADGAAAMELNKVGADDVVLGVAASGNTPFTVAALKAARESGALTVGIANNAGSQVLAASEHPILIETGAEAVAGSTRMKAGTAQKVVLNLFSTMAMVRMGRVYRGLMVDMRPTNEKLRRRAVQMVATLTGCAEEVAAGVVAKSGGDVKLAVLFARGLESDAAKVLLAKHDGNLRHALAEIAAR